MISYDLPDQINGEDYLFSSSSLLGLLHVPDNIPYVKGARVIKSSQNTGAANNFAYTIDYYADKQGATITGSKHAGNRVSFKQAFAGALTAKTWGTVPVAPTSTPPDGKYALLGVEVYGLTNYALLRFQHNDWGSYQPGFPVIDVADTALANAVSPKEDFFTWDRFQFVKLGQDIGVPCCPVFTIAKATTGLTAWCLDLVADTPSIIFNLSKVS